MRDLWKTLCSYWETLLMGRGSLYCVVEPARCCRCETPLPLTGARQPQGCDHGCGEWLSIAAVDEHLCPQLLAPPGTGWWKLAPAPPACAVCGNTMQTITIAKLFHRCPKHGIWFDTSHRDTITRALVEDIAIHQEIRRMAATGEGVCRDSARRRRE